MDQQLQNLIDRQAIEDVIARYSRTLDWLDDEGQARCYWPDADIDYGFFTGKASEFVPVVMAIERASQRRWHMLSGLQVMLVSATRASAECYGMASGIRNSDGQWSGNLYGGRYLDEFEKRGGEWRIIKRKYVMDWSLPLPNQWDGTSETGLTLPVLEITQSGHPDYRPM